MGLAKPESAVSMISSLGVARDRASRTFLSERIADWFWLKKIAKIRGNGTLNTSTYSLLNSAERPDTLSTCLFAGIRSPLVENFVSSEKNFKLILLIYGAPKAKFLFAVSLISAGIPLESFSILSIL